MMGGHKARRTFKQSARAALLIIAGALTLCIVLIVSAALA